MLHKFRVQYILIDFSDNGFHVFQSIFRFVFNLNEHRLLLALAKADTTAWRNCGVV